MDGLIKKILKNRIISGIFLASFVFVLSGTLWAYFVLRSVSGPLILHFNNLTDINQIGDLTELIWIGATGLIIVVVGFRIALELEARDWFLGKLLASTMLLFGILIFIGFTAIISVN